MAIVLRPSHWLQYYNLAVFAHAVVETKERWKKGNASRPNVLPSAASFTSGATRATYNVHDGMLRFKYQYGNVSKQPLVDKDASSPL